MRDDFKIKRITIEFYIKDDFSLNYKSADVKLNNDEKIQFSAQPNQILINGSLYIKESSSTYKDKEKGTNILKLSYLQSNKILE